MDFTTDVPIYIQIMELIKTDIVTGKLQKGEKMMSTRDLAISLKVNPNTVQRVYRELEQEEVCFTKRGMGTFVTEDEVKICELKESLADEKIKMFIESMKSLNLNVEDIIKKIKFYEEASQ